MELTLPPHVAAAWADETSLSAWLTTAATAEAERRAVDAARADAEAVLAAARAPFADGPATPTEPTLAQQVTTLHQRVDKFAGLAADLVGLVGGDRQAAETLVAEVIAEPER